MDHTHPQYIACNFRVSETKALERFNFRFVLSKVNSSRE